MCFYDESDWTADVYDDQAWPFGRPTQCDECFRTLGYGDWRRTIHMEESECCKECGLYPGDTPDDPDTACELCDYGETADYVRCLACEKILLAIEASEADAGCPPHSRRPMLTELGDAIDYEDGDRYRERALAMFPELAGHKLLQT